MEELVIEVERRDSTGKGVNRKLRHQGLIPAVVYGAGKEPVPVVVDRHAVTELLRLEKGRNSVFLLRMKGTKQERQAMVREAQINPLTHQYIHLDFIRVLKGQLVKVEVPVVLDGEPVGVKAGGFMDWVGRTLHVECAAEIIPSAIHVDIADLDLGQHVTAADLALPDGVKLLDDAHRVIATIEAHGRKTEEEEKAEAEAAAAAAEEKAEPEVIKRGKAVAEGEDAE
jgi:large subunit ribosomal protein L25